MESCDPAEFQKGCKMYTLHNSVRNSPFICTFSQDRCHLQKIFLSKKIFNWYLIFVLIYISLAIYMFFSMNVPIHVLGLLFWLGIFMIKNWFVGTCHVFRILTCHVPHNYYSWLSICIFAFFHTSRIFHVNYINIPLEDFHLWHYV